MFEQVAAARSSTAFLYRFKEAGIVFKHSIYGLGHEFGGVPTGARRELL